MEAAGLAVGAVALAGLATDCIDLYSYVTVAKSMGRDYDILSTKLDIQKALLLQWVSRVKLFEPDYDKRLDENPTAEPIARTLHGIKLLLSEGDELQHQYGEEGDRSRRICVELAPAKSGSTSALQEATRMNEALSRPFAARLPEKSKSSIRQKNRSFLNKTLWAIKDRDKFDTLIQDLSHLTSSLNTLMADKNNSLNTDLKHAIGKITNDSFLRLIQDAATGEKSNISTLACQRRILKQLWFRDIDRRMYQVSRAHENTFQWALKPPSDGDSWDDLSGWLRKESGIYWMCGKAGSGKSTLMKYLVHQQRTIRYLHEWAHGRKLVYASFFLWNLGTNNQKSQHGLARGLLYHVLEENDSIISKALPRMWIAALEGQNDLPLPSENELKEALCSLGEDTEDTTYCFFIDGLDEFSGNYRDGIAFIKALTYYPNIKVLVSSRPIDACVGAFSSNFQLHLQDLTRGDIEIYIENTLLADPCLSVAVDYENDSIKRLSNAIAARASGVFLWVILACRSLLEGFDSGDYLEELYRRLHDLPPELKDLFQHMLDRVPARYRPQSAKLLKICYEYFNKTNVFGGESLPTLILSIADAANMNIYHHPSFHPLPLEEKQKKCRLLERRLQSRCSGLLELECCHSSSPLSCFCGKQEEAGKHDSLVDSGVTFMHRTVFEYLSDPLVWERGCLQILDSKFDPMEILSYMNAHCIYLRSPGGSRRYSTKFIGESLFYFQTLDQKANTSNGLLLCFRHLMAAILLNASDFGPDSFDDGRSWNFGQEFPDDVILLDLGQKSSDDGLSSDFGAESPDGGTLSDFEQEPFDGIFSRLFLSTIGRLKDIDHLALLLAVEGNLYHFVRQRLEEIPITTVGRSQQLYPLLYYSMYRKSQLSPFSPEMIGLLLNHGHDANENFVDAYGRYTTPWRTWLSSFHEAFGRVTTREHLMNFVRITHMFLRAGADTTSEDPKVHPPHAIYRANLELTLERLMKLYYLPSGIEQISERDALNFGQLCKDILRFPGAKSIVTYYDKYGFLEQLILKEEYISMIGQTYCSVTRR